MTSENDFDCESVWKKYFFGNSETVDICDLLKRHHDLREIPEFVDSLLTFLSKHLIVVDLSDEILNRFSTYCQNLPPVQTEKLLANLISAINKTGVNNGPINLKISVELLIRLLLTIRITERNFVSVKKSMKAKFLEPLLKICLLKSQDQSACKAILSLVYVCGEMNMILHQYFDVTSGKEKLSVHAYNLNTLHHYFDDWKALYSNLKENNNNSCNYVFAALVLQKVRSVKLLQQKHGVSDVSTQCLQSCARFLHKLATKHFKVDSSVEENIWLMVLNNLPQLMEFWDKEMIVLLIRQIVEVYITENNKQLKEETHRIITSDTLSEMKQFQSTFISIIWRKIYELPALSINIFEKLSRFPDEDSSAYITEICNELNSQLNSPDLYNIDIDIVGVNQHFQILGMLRHEYLSPTDKIRCVLGIVTLLSKLKVTGENISEAWNLVSQCHQLLGTTLKDCECVTNYISVGVIYTWFLKLHARLCNFPIAVDVLDCQLKSFEKAFSALITNTMRTKKSLCEITPFINDLTLISKKKIRRKMAESEVKLYLSATDVLLKSLLQISLEVSLKNNCEQIIQLLMENLKSVLNEESLVPYLINSVAIIVKTKYYQDCKEQCLNIVTKSLNNLLDCQNVEQVLSNLEVISSFATEIPQLQHDIWTKIKIVYQTDAIMANNFVTSKLNAISADFASRVDENQLTNIFNDIRQGIMINEVSTETIKHVICCLNLWEAILNNSQRLKKDKLDVIQQDVTNDILIACLHLIHKPAAELRWAIIRPTITLVDKIIQNSSSQFQCTQVEICLHICVSILNCTRIRFAPEEFSGIFNSLCSVVNGVLHCQLPTIVTMLTVVISCLNGLVSFLLEYGDQSEIKSIEEELPRIEECSQHLSRLFLRYSQLSKDIHARSDVERLSPYIIAEYIMRSQQVTLLPSVKDILINGVYRIMDLCDEHSISLLQTNLPPSGKEVFKYFLQNYKTMHKYSGRV